MGLSCISLLTMARNTLVFFCVLVASCQVEGVRDFCEDEFGTIYELEQKWEQGDELCECVHPQSVYFVEDWDIPADAIIYCLLNASWVVLDRSSYQYVMEKSCPAFCGTLTSCHNPSGGPVFREGDVFQDGSGDICKCMAGTDPLLADAHTLFYAKCDILEFLGLDGDSLISTVDK